jgi:cobalt-zinc-cadmium efflux system membrane fusion protein
MRTVRTLTIGAALALAGASAFGCRQPAPPAGSAAASPPDAQKDADNGATVRIDPSMASSVHVEVVTLHDVPRQLRTTGTVQLDESRVARILAPVAGQVTGLHVNVGDRVRQGETLFSLNSRDAAAAIEDAIDARHDLALADKTLTMTQDLFDHQAASRIALQQAQTDLNKARSRIARVDATLAAIGIQPRNDLDRLDALVPVNAPMAGVVLDRKVSERQYVQPDPNPLLTIADLSSVWVEADVFERDLRLLRVGESADVQTTAYPDSRFNARVARVGDVLDAGTRTVKVRFQVANASLRLKPEMFATVTLLVDDTERAVTVPAAAVLTEGERSFVYVAIDDRTFARRFIEVADESRDSRRVLRGLAPGDRVATTGAILLRGQEDRGAS